MYKCKLCGKVFSTRFVIEQHHCPRRIATQETQTNNDPLFLAEMAAIDLMCYEPASDSSSSSSSDSFSGGGGDSGGGGASSDF
jgi:uncharacterized membrane protein YgcG